MNLTKNIITRSEAVKIAPDYVKAMEGNSEALCEKVFPVFDKIKRGQKALTCLNRVYVMVKVTKVDLNDIRAVDGPVVRVSNGEYSWRVDGNDWAWPV